MLKRFVLTLLLLSAPFAWARPIKVVVSQSAYRPIVEFIGGDKVEVHQIVNGNEDPHIVRPKPSFAVLLRDADLYVTTGMDLEMWSPGLVDMSGNPNIRSGQKGYVSASAGVKVIDEPITISRSEGDVHIYGNPHIHTSPLNGKVIAENIAVGLKRVAPEHAAYFDANLQRFKAEIDRRMFGEELCRLLGGKLLTDLAQNGKLMAFLEHKQYQGSPLITRLGGWMKAALPLRGKKIVAYHKTIDYFANLFGIEIVAFMEPKPGIPPTPGHVSEVIETMRKEGVKVMWAENYFDIGQVKRVAERVGARTVIVALGPGGQPGMNTYFDIFDIWIRELLKAFEEAQP